jgi:hypothetical protein
MVLLLQLLTRSSLVYSQGTEIILHMDWIGSGGRRNLFALCKEDLAVRAGNCSGLLPFVTGTPSQRRLPFEAPQKRSRSSPIHCTPVEQMDVVAVVDGSIAEV